MTAMGQLEVEPALPERWDDVVAVMGTRGDAAWCWCQYFRFDARTMRESTRDLNRERLHEQVVADDGPPPGVLAYLEGEPVGWCAVAPKVSYPRLQRSPVTRTTGADPPDRTWVVSCFQVRPAARRRGVTTELLEGAIGLARDHDATAVEAYAVDPSRRSSVSSAELFHGPLSLFLRAGFEEVARPYSARVVVRRDLARN